MRRQEDGPPRWLLLLALLLLGTALGIELFRRIGAPSVPPELPPIQAQAAPPGASPSSAPVPAPAGDRLALVRTTLTGDELLSLLMSKAEAPAARAFADAFMKAHELKQAWVVFQGDKDAPKFVHAVRESETFKALLAEFQEKPAFRKLVDEAAAQPGIGALLRESRDGQSGEALSLPGEHDVLSELAPAARVGAFTDFGKTSALEREVMASVTPAQAVKLRSAFVAGKSVREACAGAGLGLDCQGVPLLRKALAEGLWGNALGTPPDRGHLDEGGELAAKAPGLRGSTGGWVEAQVGKSPAPKPNPSPQPSDGGCTFGGRILSCGSCDGGSGNAMREFVCPDNSRVSRCVKECSCPGASGCPALPGAQPSPAPIVAPTPTPTPTPTPGH